MSPDGVAGLLIGFALGVQTTIGVEMFFERRRGKSWQQEQAERRCPRCHGAGIFDAPWGAYTCERCSGKGRI